MAVFLLNIFNNCDNINTVINNYQHFNLINLKFTEMMKYNDNSLDLNIIITYNCFVN